MQVATIILAGGQGTRLNPLTTHHSKPAIPYGGRHRLIDIPISNSINSNFRQIFVITQYLSEELNNYIKETYLINKNQVFLNILSPQKDKNGQLQSFAGTADAIRKNLSAFLKTSADYFLILSGDQLYNIDFQEIIAFSRSKDADLTIASIPVSRKEASRMGLLKIDANNRVIDFIEKPRDENILRKFELSANEASQSLFLGSMGIYVFKREALVSLFETDSRNDFGYHLIDTAVKKGNVAAYIYEGYWEDIGTVASYYNANLMFTHSDRGLNTYDQKNPIYSRPTFLPGPKIKNTKISQSIICEGCIIEAEEISNSIIGFCSQVKKGTTIRNTVMMGNHFLEQQETLSDYWIGENCIIDKVIIDERVRIGNDVKLTNKSKYDHFDGHEIFVRDGIVIVPAGANIENGYEF
jgi:glucose-1-phosphate adenylyltransferase